MRVHQSGKWVEERRWDECVILTQSEGRQREVRKRSEQSNVKVGRLQECGMR